MPGTQALNEDIAVFDYIIVGAGAAGCVVANRLSEDPAVSVCLIEAGPPDHNLFIKMPAGFIKMVGNPRYTWNFQTQPTALTGDRAVNLLQGRTLGGGTSVNGMAYNRGQAHDFDEWAAAGNAGWGYKDLLPLFMDMENRQGGDPLVRGSKGPLAITDVCWEDTLCSAFIDGVVECGTPRNSDTNGQRQEGVSFSQVSIKDGRRVSSSSAFLQPVLHRKNLQVMTDTLATRVLMEGKKARGVSVQQDVRSFSMMARREVILSAGAINTPRLLQVSGIGDTALLENIGVKRVHHLPGVGQNLQDHYMVQIVARGKNFTSINQLARGPGLLWQGLRWSLKKPSLLGLPVALVHYFMRSGLSQGDADIQGIFTPASHMTGSDGQLDQCAGMTCAVWQHRPISRGFVAAVSASMHDAPLVQPNYLAHEHDRRVLLEACRKVRAILASQAMRPYFEAEMIPGVEISSDEQWLDFACKTGSTVFHPVGTARMGPATDPYSVVDDTLRVHGLEGLRVIDASIMPNLTSANTAAATMVIGEKGARMILCAQAPSNAASGCALHERSGQVAL
ncbi:GMC family oxidoreductase [Pseudomonas bohemica]|uniref:GMC family oxidoreductase n=1 Tax=Pseudomonas bohemica TaxID=2044872 RepID=UPI000DA5FD27|nr:GMC family oxidoreductase N-terminal domain-containing protein [Pseudomonas bohemica]